MIKIIASFECVVDGKKCSFLMDHDTPIAYAKKMAELFISHLDELEKKCIEEGENKNLPREVKDEHNI